MGRQEASNIAREVLRAQLALGEVELAFGRGQAREGNWVLLTDRRLLWGSPGSPHVARFKNDAGLAAGTPPSRIAAAPYFADQWKDHDMRLQRLHQIIEELTGKWS